jgi:DNA polymerase-4
MLLDAARPLVRERGLTLVGVALTNLESDAIVQPQLCFGPVDTNGMDKAVDAVAARFGNRAVQRASLLRSGDGFSVPTLED